MLIEILIRVASHFDGDITIFYGITFSFFEWEGF